MRSSVKTSRNRPKTAGTPDPSASPKISPPTVTQRKVAAPRLEELRLPDIINGVGAAPGIEIFNGALEGFDALDSSGAPWLVILSRPPIADPNADNTEDPHTLTLQRAEIASDGISVTEMVLQYDIVPSISDHEIRLNAARLGKAAELLRDPTTFEAGRRELDQLCAHGALVQQSFVPQTEAFQVPGQLQYECERLSPNQSLEVFLRKEHPEFISDLEQFLREHDVPHEVWGKGEAKRLIDLACELARGEGELSVTDGTVYIESRVVMLWLESPDGKKRLFEQSQRFSDGRTRKRRNLGALPAEKAEPLELSRETLTRLHQEELQIDEIRDVREAGISRRLEPSQCYPGVVKRNTYIVYEARLAPSDYRHAFSEETPSKTTFFQWTSFPRGTRRSSRQERKRASQAQRAEATDASRQQAH